ncbi:hypothetical protein EYF80_066628 [Liparis tanakae]|uniref:Uncharacterized protein n=1 Tax=Liparis tanakae TaxID=230148 RepID=A0A4Z2E3F7_9TELE|nr:hypothetical protein EYF80_066628 [Liparis tanakae]
MEIQLLENEDTASVLQHPSPLKDPILSSRTPKQLLRPPFLFRLHERLEVLWRSLKSRARRFCLASRTELLGSEGSWSWSWSSGAPNHDLSVSPSFFFSCSEEEYGAGAGGVLAPPARSSSIRAQQQTRARAFMVGM